MNFRQFAFRNVIRKKRTYAAHFLSSAFSVMVFFIYAVLLFHPDLQGQLKSSSGVASYLGTMGLKVSQYLIFIFSFLFLLYSTSAFLKVRKKEFGILAILGMSESQRKKLTFIENMIIGTAAIVGGILVGVLCTKLMLLASSRLLMLEEGLAFYIPFQAIWMTAGAFTLLFIVISLLTTRIGRRNEVLELIKSDEKPRPEPKASLLLTLLSIVLIGAGYGMVFHFVNNDAYYLWLIASAVGCVVLGTYFLFTQLSVYVIRALKRREGLFFRKVNLLTFTDLAYRMKDNAIMFFMVATVMAVAFSGVGVCLVIGDPDRSERENPYAFTYVTYPGSELTEKHLNSIDGALQEEGFIFEKTAVETNNDDKYPVIRLSEYNKLAKLLNYKQRTLNDDQMFILSGSIGRKGKSNHVDFVVDSSLLEGKQITGLELKERVNDYILPVAIDTIIVPDVIYASISSNKATQSTVYYVMPEWEKTLPIARELQSTVDKDLKVEKVEGSTENESTLQIVLSALVVDWYNAKQLNGILLIISVLVAVVFFTFAASFIYFRLYADLDRDEKQYEMIGKIGLSSKELGRLVTRQLLLMFFLPFVIGAVHSTIAFVNMGNLVQLPMLKHALYIYGAFLAVQIIYFFLIRSRYLGHMRRKLT
ncbi:ABC transporter permease [Paenibacillus sp. GSMTC-2017]|uniref:ABC transporter permease n=1 Tax=Paenibacillus sp. GSMTC-2017 TaxID=2794350 RepID=UPI0018D5DE2D|nr:ABC transporter permease [Paenibacillus sp. GSMTC-2017]MBH5317496.1 ABC transporter permease [Paenibacillus sp. GSMTC-2017]